ncbi:MAG: 3-isopropylmalate dehydratase small subunit [Congregibacter sp.]|nr:3-isopropylmalate dehydratase small subunit [Congregibacter sp.]
MTPFTQHRGVALPLLRDNIDTDAIIPSREMRTVSRSGLAAGLFAPWRYLDPDARTLDPDFALNQPEYGGASILLAGDNFGCGSSREHAVWALMESGFRAVIAPSFATIFRNNALRNGLLTVALERYDLNELVEWVSIDPAAQTIQLDLETCTIETDPARDKKVFSVDPTARDMLLKGLDEIGLTEQTMDLVAHFEEQDQVRRPWVYLAGD